MKPDRKNESHHYIPRFYLQHWCSSDGKLWVYPVDGKPGFRATPKNFAAEKGLYDTSDVPDFAAIDQEGDLSKIEGLYSSQWPDIFNGTMDSQTKMNISRFLALIYLRHPKRKDDTRQTNAWLRKLVELAQTREPHQLRYPRCGYAFTFCKGSKRSHLPRLQIGVPRPYLVEFSQHRMLVGQCDRYITPRVFDEQLSLPI